MYIKSIRFKASLLYSGILLGILIIYNTILFFSVRSILIKDIDGQLSVKAGEISNIFEAYEKTTNISSHPMSILENLLRAHGVIPQRQIIIDDLWRSEFKTLRLNKDYINILTATGRTLISSSNLTPAIRDCISQKFGFSKEREYIGSVNHGLVNLRVINLPFLYKQNLPLTIQVATSLNPAYTFLARFMMISSLCLLLVVAVTSFLGSFFVRRILSPVVAVTKTANAISHRDLSTRIKVQNTDIEMKQLITSFNAMIERLEKSFMYINEFNSYVAHELKTPLAIVKGELELAVEQAQEKGDDQKVLSDCLEEVDRMIKITKDLLLLAKLDYQPQILRFERIDFRKFFEEVAEHGAMLAAEKEIEVTPDYPDLQKSLFINADKVHLRRLFLNVITNAIKYTPRGGKIHLSVRQGRDNLYVDIADTGEGISEQDLRRIFDKFFRVDKVEQPHDAGFGLGLSIALSIAKAHQGAIKVKSKLKEGTTFTVVLPLAF